MIAQLDSAYIKARPSKVVTRLLSYGLFEGRPLTTRGRWVNPLIFALFALEKRMPQLKEVRAPIFILGTGRSGSTILGLVLSIHEDVGFLNEPKALWHAIHPEEDLVGSYSSEAAHYRLTEADATDEVCRDARRLYGAYLRATRSKRVVDKYPELIFRVPFVRAIFPDARFLLLVRNGWDTCRSIDGWSRRLGMHECGELNDWWGVNHRKWKLLAAQVAEHEPLLQHARGEIRTLTRHVDMAAVEWIVTMQEGLRLIREMPDRVLAVHYEDLVSRPNGIVSSISNHCGLRPDETLLTYAQQVLRPVLRGAPLDLHPILRQPFHQTMDELGY